MAIVVQTRVSLEKKEKEGLIVKGIIYCLDSCYE